MGRGFFILKPVQEGKLVGIKLGRQRGFVHSNHSVSKTGDHSLKQLTRVNNHLLPSIRVHPP
jgi:hypothetical protein